MCLELSVRRVAKDASHNHFRVELPEPRVMFIAIADNGDLVGLDEIPTAHRLEVIRLITLATTGHKI